jgi:hypothetical protein
MAAVTEGWRPWEHSGVGHDIEMEQIGNGHEAEKGEGIVSERGGGNWVLGEGEGRRENEKKIWEKREEEEDDGGGER